MTDIGGDRFTVKAEASCSPVILGWMFRLGDKVEINELESLHAAKRDMLATGNKIYNEHV
jgi:hypothetical protein